LDAELISMRFEELVRTQSLAFSPAHKYDSYFQPRTQLLALVEEKLMNPVAQCTQSADCSGQPAS
jgi:hypothetical protein